MQNNNAQHPGPHVHIPYELIDKYLAFVRENRLNFELYFGSKIFDSITDNDLVALGNKFDHNPRISFHAPFMDLSPGGIDPGVREVTMKRFTRTLDFAEILRPAAIVFHSGYERWKYAHRIDIWLEQSLKIWRPVNERAADIGTKVAIENVFEDEPGNLIALVKELDSENFGLCFDTGHFNLFSSITLLEWLKVIKPYIKEFHLHDNLRYADDHLAIGDGDFDFATLFEIIRGVDGVYTIEARSEEEAMKSIEKLKGYLE